MLRISCGPALPACLTAWLCAGVATAQTSSVTLVTAPAELVRGSLCQLIAVPAPSAPSGSVRLSGELAGEPLHFLPRGRDSLAAIAGIPIEGGDSIMLRLVLERPGQPDDTVALTLPVRQASYARERLRVAPSMAEPDSLTRLRIAAEIARAREVSRQSHLGPRLWREAFVLPRTSRRTSGYGATREFNGVVTSRHLGTDFAGRLGDPVRAVNVGVVALVADFYLAGTALYLDHGAGLVTAYFHLSRVDVAVGDTVRAGQVIGAVGRSGRVTGPHLHWVARYGAISVDPMSLLDLEKANPRVSTKPVARPGAR